MNKYRIFFDSDPLDVYEVFVEAAAFNVSDDGRTAKFYDDTNRLVAAFRDFASIRKVSGR